MRCFWLLACFVVLSSARTSQDSEKMRFDNYSVYELNISNKMQLKLINRLCDASEKYNIWKYYDNQSRKMHVMVDPTEVKRFLLLLKLYGISHEVLIANVQSLIDTETEANSRYSNTFGWKRYNTLAEIETWLDGILEKYSNVTEEFVVGTSYEGRTIRGIKISYKEGNPGVIIESNIHANEWITSATATWFINELLSSENQVVRELAENHDWYIVPVLNVDGFVYSHEKNRMWRKTRQPSNFSSCIGVDPNRNYDSHWMQNDGASDDPCSQVYGGSHAYSEPEIKAMSEFILSIKDKVNVLLAFHSYGQVLLSPYGHTAEEFPENYADLMQVAKAYADAVGTLSYGSVFQYGSVASVLYQATGATNDWAYEQGILISYTIEFRDSGNFGFVLPPAFILPNCEETLTGIIALLGECQKLGYLDAK
ncbi:zinc carboxypeptidase-like [Drosophila nasuta]|uniref:zinc carboxypeptidase-like n=1 Tax=Drosophila nasuta TaxID=42062 RepID=UPI00295E4D1F|nr:zinc carboxypeptidase-like [Drosophila nasuta]